MNRQKVINKLLIYVISAVISASCGETNLIDSEESLSDVTLELIISKTFVKSSIEIQEDQISNLNIFAFSNGLMAGHTYTEDISRSKISLSPGKYRLYIIANCGPIKDMMTEEDIINWRYRISSSTDLAELPQAYTAKTDITVKGGTRNTATMTLVRLISRCGFRFNATNIPGLTIQSVRLCQAALDVQPFNEEGSSPQDIEDYGDYASDKDIQEINEGKTIYFYTLENVQGTLLPGNDDPWEKVPDNIQDKAAECTYIEVTGTFDGIVSGGISGNVKYRFFLGEDAATNFSIKRNTEYVVNMTASQEGLERISWMIDTSEMIHDPLAGQIVITIPEYAGQWGKISIEKADESTPVELSNGKQTIIVGKNISTIQTMTMDNGCIIYYAPSVSKTDAFIYSSPEKISTTAITDATITISSSVSSKEINMSVPHIPYYAIRETGNITKAVKFNLNEDGYDAQNIEFLLTDNTGAILPPDRFIIPEQKLAALLGYKTEKHPDGYIYGSLNHDFIAGIEISSTDVAGCNIENLDSRDLTGQIVLTSGIIYGTTPGNADMRFSNKYGCARSASVRCNVSQAFPGQRYLGEISNTQLDINGKDCEDHTETHTLNLYNGSTGTSHAEWNIVRISPSEGTNPNASAYSRKKDGHDNIIPSEFNAGKLNVKLIPPEADNSNSIIKDFFASGAFCIKGAVTNPHTGKVIEGYWIQDIILEFTVTAQVDFMPGYVCFTYVPYNIWFATPKYSKMWKSNLPLLIKPDNLVSDNLIGDDSQDQTFILGNKLLGLVPFMESEKDTKLTKEYRVMTLVPSGYDESNRYPFCIEREDELTGMLWENLSYGTSETGIDIAQRTKSSFIPLRKDGTRMPQERSIIVTRQNAANYNAFEGFYRITRDYGSYTSSLLGNIGRYVIEASPKAQEYQSPFYSDIL